MSKLTKYTNWDIIASKHLMSRTLSGFSLQNLKFAASISLDSFIDDYLLAPLSPSSAPGEWVNNSPNPINGHHYVVLLDELTLWKINLLHNSSLNIESKIELFWHNHFVSEARKIWQAERMYWQNDLIRRNSLGNLRDFTKEITVDSAMLQYLDGTDNKKNSLNENYARELLELFTIGIGNYSQQDIREAAKALTGWMVEPDKLNPVFKGKLFHHGEKFFLGIKGNFNHKDIIDIIYTKPQTAYFICNKFCQEFLDPNPDPEFVNELAEVFIQNDFEIKPVLSALFKSTYFYEQQFKGCKIQSPIDFVFNLIKKLNVQKVNYGYIKSYLARLEQPLFNPPDVRGWEGHKKWINATTLPFRNAFSDSILTGLDHLGNPNGMEVDIFQFIKQFPASDNINNLIEEITAFFFSIPLSENRKVFLKEILLDGSPDYEWDINNTEIEPRVKKFFIALFRLPEYQLI